MKLDIVILGLSITSSWGNGHATTYRALAKGLSQRGHSVTFLERDTPWYRGRRDLRHPPYCRTELYEDLKELPRRFGDQVRNADLVMLGSFVPDGAAIAEWITMHARGVTAFYDIDTPVTLAGLDKGGVEYINARVIPRFDLYLSFTGGPALGLIESAYGARAARPLYCAVDPELHKPCDVAPALALGFVGTYSPDRQPALERLLIEPARRLPALSFAVAGAQFPADMAWPANVDHVEHLPPDRHARFYCAQRYTLNVTRADMVAAGFSPSVRLFEAAACGAPVITDRWAGIEQFFTPGEEILIADSADDVVTFLRDIPDERRCAIAAAARRRALSEHTAQARAWELEEHCRAALARQARSGDKAKLRVGAVA
jgi:spore maturation protein CgeB